MRANMGIIASGQIPPVTSFVFDAKGNAGGSDVGGRAPLTWTHTPVGVPKGVVVLVASENSSVDAVTGVTYGGVTMTEASGSPLNGLLGSEENCMLYAYVLTSSVPTGAQTVSVANSDTGAAFNGVSFTVVGPNDSAVEDTSTADTLGADPTCALTINEESFVCGVLVSGQDTAAGVAVGASMTQALEIDTGSQVMSFAYRTALVSTNSSVDWTATSEDYAIFAVALKST